MIQYKYLISIVSIKFYQIGDLTKIKIESWNS